MLAFADLKDVLKTSVRWEKKLEDFYDVAEFALKSEQSKKAVELLKQHQTERRQVLENVDPERFGKSEWIQFARAYRDDELIPVRDINRDSTPEQILQQILSFEEKLREFYTSVRDRVVNRNQQELFASLVTFKENQIEDIRRLLA